MNWSFSSGFKQEHPARVRELERWHCFDDIVDEMMSTKCKVQLPKPQVRCGDASVIRTSFSVTVGQSAADAFFNSPNGYRASYLRATTSEGCREIDATILESLIEKYRSTLEMRPGLVESLRRPQAKVWIRQDSRIDRSLKGEQRCAPEIEVSDWMKNLDVPVQTKRGACYLARAGTLASDGHGVIVVKGAWVKDGVTWEDDGKLKRAAQIAAYGFT